MCFDDSSSNQLIELFGHFGIPHCFHVLRIVRVLLHILEQDHYLGVPEDILYIGVSHSVSGPFLCLLFCFRLGVHFVPDFEQSVLTFCVFRIDFQSLFVSFLGLVVLFHSEVDLSLLGESLGVLWLQLQSLLHQFQPIIETINTKKTNAVGNSISFIKQEALFV